jgi:hypothetical protein
MFFTMDLPLPRLPEVELYCKMASAGRAAEFYSWRQRNGEDDGDRCRHRPQDQHPPILCLSRWPLGSGSVWMKGGAGNVQANPVQWKGPTQVTGRARVNADLQFIQRSAVWQSLWSACARIRRRVLV